MLSRYTHMNIKYWTIKEFGKIAGVTVRTLQYYDEQGLLIPHHKTTAGYRYYSNDDLQTIQQISILKYIGFNLTQIKSIRTNDKLDLVSYLNLQMNALRDNQLKIDNGLMLIQQTIDLYHNNNEVEWQAIAKILKVLKMKENNTYKEWIQRNFSNSEVNLFAEMVASQKGQDDGWFTLFTEAKKLMNLDPSAPPVQTMAKQWMDVANQQYQTSDALKIKMWELMKSGDIPEGTIPGYEQSIVLFMNTAIEIMYSK